MKPDSASDHRPEIGEPQPEGGFVTFRLGEQWLGISVLAVQEVLVGNAVSPVPLAPRAVQGFLNLRGQVVTAVDLREVLALPARDPGAPFMNVVVKDEGELFSLLVDEVGHVRQAHDTDIETPPTTLDPRWRRRCVGVVRMERDLLVVLDVDAVLRGEVEPSPASHSQVASA